MYHHYLPTASRPTARRPARSWVRRPSPGQPCPWPTSSTRWSGMFVAGERPTGSRDPYGIRRAAQGLVRLLADLPELTGVDARSRSGPGRPRDAGVRPPTPGSPRRRLGLPGRPRAQRVRAAWRRRAQRARRHPRRSGAAPADRPAQAGGPARPDRVGGVHAARHALQARPEHRPEPRAPDAPDLGGPSDRAVPNRPLPSPRVDAPRAGHRARRRRRARLPQGVCRGAALGPAVARFFDDVMVMADDPRCVRRASADASARTLILQLADVSEMVPQSEVAKSSVMAEDEREGRARARPKHGRQAAAKARRRTKQSTSTSSAAARPTATGR